MNRKSKLAAAFLCGAVLLLAAMGIGRVEQVQMVLGAKPPATPHHHP